MQQKEYLKEQIDKYLSGECTPEEQASMDAWFLEQKENQPSFDLSESTLETDLETSWTIIAGHIHASKQTAMLQRRVPSWIYWASSAAALLIFGTVVFYQALFPTVDLNQEIAVRSTIVPRTAQIEQQVQKSIGNSTVDASPATERAKLILSDGRVIEIGGINSGTRIDHTTGIDFTADDQIIYRKDNSNTVGDEGNSSNTIITPKASTYTVVLVDGTKVHLNAGSKLTFPLAFNQETRQVYLEGEAFFEVSKRSIDIPEKGSVHQDFIVKTNKGSIRVLGTKFNVSAHKGDATSKTTLQEGAVEVYADKLKSTLRLAPGQQATISTTNMHLREASIEKELAWLHGDFVFDGESVAEIMTEIGRWYDVDIQYVGEIPSQRYISTISRKKSLKEVLEILETSTSLQFSIQINDKERRLMVIP